MKWSNLWKVLRVISENAPLIIAAIEAVKHKETEPTRPGPA